jgi:3-phenylpropionate/cinnamic acid dioxygenase small subunit
MRNFMDALDHLEIQNLIYRYGDLLDRGLVDDAGALFEHAEFHVEGQSETLSRRGQNRMAQVFQQWIGHFPERAGRPTTRHATSNLIVEPDGQNRARAQSYVIVFQSGSPISMQSSMGATYSDRFVKIGGRWRFAERTLRPFGQN